jgi:hypothetical protein
LVPMSIAAMRMTTYLVARNPVWKAGACYHVDSGQGVRYTVLIS